MEHLEFNDELRGLLTVGAKVRSYYGKNNRNNKTMHIREIVDGEYVVYKVWSYRKQCWIYQVDWWYRFALMLRDGNLLKA